MVMRNSCIYDTQGQDGIDNKAAWQSLPSWMRLIVRQTQQKIMSMLYENNPDRIFVKTSGFRSPRTTRRYGGQDHSNHHFGGAVDVRRSAGDTVPVVGSGFICVTESDHFHIQYEVTI